MIKKTLINYTVANAGYISMKSRKISAHNEAKSSVRWNVRCAVNGYAFSGWSLKRWFTSGSFSRAL